MNAWTSVAADSESGDRRTQPLKRCCRHVMLQKKMSKYRAMFRVFDVAFRILSLWVHPNKCVKETYLLSTAKIWQWSVITWKPCAIGHKLLLCTNMKSHAGFTLVSKSVTLNDLERKADRRTDIVRAALNYVAQPKK